MDTRKNKGISGAGLLVLVVFLFAVLWFTNMFENQSDRLTWSEFQTLVTGDNVDSISVIQNKNVPTGHVEIKLRKIKTVSRCGICMFQILMKCRII